MSRRFLALLPVFLALLIFGCGGGGHSSKPGGTGVTDGGATDGGATDGGATNGGDVLASPQITIAWPAKVRPRAIEAPVLAKEVSISMTPLKAGTQTLNARLARPAGQNAVTETTTLSPSVLVGDYTLDVRFLADAFGDTVIAQATLPVKLLASGEIQRPDGKPLGTVVAEGKIVGVRILNVPALDPGDTASFGVAIDVQQIGRYFVPPPGLLRLRVTSGGNVLRANDDNTVTALAPGTATVVASVPGFTSPPTTFTVASDPVLPARSITVGTYDSLTRDPYVYTLYEDPARGHLWAVDGASVVEVDPTAGTIVRRVSSRGTIGSFSLSDDGTVFYTTSYPYIDGSYYLIRHDAATGSILGYVDYGRTEIGNVTIQPGHNDVAAVWAYPSPGVAILDGTTPRPNTIAPLGRPVWLSETRLAIIGPGIRTATVDAQGLTLDGAANPDFQAIDGALATPSGGGVTVVDGRIYTRNAVYDATTLAFIGAFGDSYLSSPPVIANGLAFFMDVRDDAIQIAIYRLSDRSLVGRHRIAGHPFSWSPSQLRRWGAHGLAFIADKQLYLVDEVPGL